MFTKNKNILSTKTRRLSMKFNYRFILLAIFAVALLLPAKQVKAQASGDTLTVDWMAADGTVATDALLNAINNDTERPAGRVYKLMKGGFYWITETIANSGWTLRIVGEKPDPNDVYGNPAVLQMVARTDGSVNGRILTGNGSILMKNVYIVGADNNGVQTYYQPIQIDASDSRFEFDGCVFERTNFALVAFTAKNNDIFFTNCKFRNLIGQPSTQQWEGRGISIWADQDTVVVENCTFFNVGMTALQIEGGAANYVRFNHNTLVNVGRSINTGNWWRDAYFTNNLIINGFFHGEGFADYNPVANPNRRGRTSGLFSVGALPTKYGAEEARRVVFAKAASWRDPLFAAYYGDTIRAQPYINEITAADFINKYDNMVVNDTLWLNTRPDIATYPEEIVASMIQNIKDLRASVTPATPYFWQLPSDPTVPSWPLPENFSYSNSQLASYGTNNFPLGDLNWLPAKKAEWEAMKDKDIKDIEALAGNIVILEPLETIEAEAGTVAGGAEVKSVAGFVYYEFDSGGELEWKFNVATAGDYNLKIWTHMRNNSIRGQHTFINGVEIHDAAHGYGELVFDTAAGPTAGMPINEWTWVTFTQADLKEAGALTLPAGENTIKITPSWGWQRFAGIDLVPVAGGTTIQLRGADVTFFDVVKQVVEGAVWTPSGLKSVAMGANGTVSVDFTAPEDGIYRVQVAYQNYGTAQTGVISTDGTAVISDMAFETKADSTGLTILSKQFSLTKGAHTVKLAVPNINVDYIKFFLDKTVGVRNLDELPNGYALEQNYPNPFNPTTTINFSIGKASNVNLTIYNILGQKVATLVNSFLNAGSYSVQFNANRLSSGVYFYSIEAGDFRINKKMMLLK